MKHTGARLYLVLATLTLSFSAINPMSSMAWESFDKAIYGMDDRVEVTAQGNDKWKELARSTAAMIGRNDFIYNSKTQIYKLKTEKTLKSVGICEDERFASQPMTALCTGFLVEPNVIMTAGHCMINQASCKDFRWVFDYRMRTEDKVKTLYSKKRVYQCKRIKKKFTDSAKSIDFALVELYRNVEDRTPLELDKETPVTGAPLVIIGHPTGLPSKIAGGETFIQKVDKYSFNANLDSFAGNSGSPVFHAGTGKVLGILVSGSPDYIYDSEKECNRVNICKEDNCRLETASFINNAFTF